MPNMLVCVNSDKNCFYAISRLSIGLKWKVIILNWPCNMERLLCVSIILKGAKNQILCELSSPKRLSKKTIKRALKMNIQSFNIFFDITVT